MSTLKKFLAATLVTLLAVMLVATIYFTLFDLEWIAFLGGVLFAAIAALTSQTARAQWLFTRRTRQLERSKGLLAEESARRVRVGRELAGAEARFRLISDALQVMIVFVDRNGHCGDHNRAFQHWCGRGGDRIAGLPLREVAGETVYTELAAHSTDVLGGRQIHYDATWSDDSGRTVNVAVTLLPYPPGIERTTGYYVLCAPAAAKARTAPVPHGTAGSDDLIVAPDSGETVYLESMAEQLLGGADPRERLVRALQQDEFILFAQEIEPLAPDGGSGRCLEVLLRLQEEEQHMLPPGGFFPVAERYNMMADIDRWVVRNLLAWCVASQLADPDWRMPLCCVNISSASLGDAGFAHYVQSELERSNMPGSGLCFEITELDLISRHYDVGLLMNALQPLGCRFTADGFGGVKVSFAPFRDLRFDFLKIDGTIIQNMLKDSSDLAKTKAIVLACRKIGVRTIAQLVETDETIAKLREIGVHYVQGFGISRPAPLAQAG
jgi:PAS domain S-box-containing protein